MHRKLLLAAAALLAGAQTVSAQVPLAAELRGGYAIPTGSWNEGEVLENGFGIGAHVIATVSPQMSVYAGYEAVRFPVDDEGLGFEGEADARDAGFRAGLIVSTPVPAGRNVSPFIEIGLLYNSLEIEASSGGVSESIESDAAIGFEAGAGFETALTPQLSLVPVIRYRRHEVEFDEVVGREMVEYVVIGVGARLRMR